jgi:hypothetical protein
MFITLYVRVGILEVLDKRLLFRYGSCSVTGGRTLAMVKTELVITVERKLCYAMKGDSPRIRREGDDANVIFKMGGVLMCRNGNGTRLS